MQRIMIILILSALFTTLFAQEGWVLERDKNGVKVYTRKTQTSNMKDSRAIAIVNSDTKEVLNLLTDFENHWKWMDRIKISRVLKKASENEFYVYYEALAPWPVSNRDIITKYYIKFSPDGKITLEAKGEPNY